MRHSPVNGRVGTDALQEGLQTQPVDSRDSQQPCTEELIGHRLWNER